MWSHLGEDMKALLGSHPVEQYLTYDFTQPFGIAGFSNTFHDRGA